MTSNQLRDWLVMVLALEMGIDREINSAANVQLQCICLCIEF